MDTETRRVNQARAIAYRDEMLEIASELIAEEPRDLRACTDLHGDIQSFLDGALIAHFPGVAARMRAELAAMGWTFAFGEECRKAYNAEQLAAPRFTGGACGKCDGKGRIGAFSHIDGGVCFTCKGTGKLDARGRSVSA